MNGQREEEQEAGEWAGVVLLAPPVAPHLCLPSARCPGGTNGTGRAGLALTVIRSVQFSSVAQSCPTLFDSVNCSTPGLPVHHQLPEFTQTHVHQVGDVI